jgi:succinate-semialdehyde dehydrogenase/glutarate-semialdehyde dehydrogenase
MGGSMALPLKDKGLLRQAMLIDGAWVQADSGRTLDVRNPANGELVARVPDAGAAETRRAIEGARKAMPGWRKALSNDRSKVLRALYELMIEHIDDLARKHPLVSLRRSRRGTSRLP